MRLIDADRLTDEFGDTIGNPISRTRLILQVQNQPTVDAVEVVRCGECKHMSPVGVCTYFADSEVRPSASDFCSYGERKDND